MEDAKTSFPADWAIEEALKTFNSRRTGSLVSLGLVKCHYRLGYAASIIAHARLIEKFQPELKPADPDEEFEKGLNS